MAWQLRGSPFLPMVVSREYNALCQASLNSQVGVLPQSGGLSVSQVSG